MPMYPTTSTPAAGGVDIDAWTQSTVSAMAELRVSSPATPVPLASSPGGIRGTAVTLDIPLDAETSTPRRQEPQPRQESAADDNQYPVYRPRREPLRRDSMKRREALLKGKEGSRRRQKWENDRLLGNPWVEPPSPLDWEPRPTHPVHAVPYALAPLWDERRARLESRTAEEQAQRRRLGRSAREQLPRPLREKLRRARGAKSLLQALEEQVRDFVAGQSRSDADVAVEDDDDDDDDYDALETSDSEEDEIVFVGRRTPASASKSTPASRETDRMVFDALESDRAGSFGRWLVHEIATYYDLDTWSVTTGNPRRREAYVGFKPSSKGQQQQRPPSSSSPPSAAGDEQKRCGVGASLPRPLYGMV